MAERSFVLFVYAGFLPGEADHPVIAGARSLGPARTKPIYKLVERGPFGALVPDGRESVVGELYELDYATLKACDDRRDHPSRFHRGGVQLDDAPEAAGDREVHAYLVHPEQARGLRRVNGGDWLARFRKQPEGSRRDAGRFVSWARKRHER